MKLDRMALLHSQSKFSRLGYGQVNPLHSSISIAAALLLSLLATTPARAAESHLPDEAEAMAILQTVCAGQIRKEVLKKGVGYGCGGCPSFTGFAGQSPSQGNEPDFELRKVLEGSFTKPGANEVLAEFFGCEPHAANFGGMLLLARAGAKWRRVRYAEGVVGMVRSFARTDGLDIVLDQGGYTGQGTTTGWISTCDFSVKPDPAEHTLLQVEDTLGNACQSDRVSISYFERLDFPDLNGDGKPDLRVTVRWGQATVPARLRNKCDEEFKPTQPPAYTVDFLFNGMTFRVAPGSAATLRKIASKE
ncbi:MAG TPA: hypothetical protein VG028_15465 [Terriglobia bacterium]|nr:hypothetical protein [Terriglobia bacterium]